MSDLLNYILTQEDSFKKSVTTCISKQKLPESVKLTILFQKPLALALLRLHLTEEDEPRRICGERRCVGASPD